MNFLDHDFANVLLQSFCLYSTRPILAQCFLSISPENVEKQKAH